MKKCLKSLAIMLSAIMTVGMVMPAAANAAEAMYVESDTTVNFSVVQGKTYAFKFTVHGTHNNPKIAAGNGTVLRTEDTSHEVINGNDVYYFKVRAIGASGQSSAIYTTLPNQQAVKHCEIKIAPPYVKSDTTSDFSLPHNTTYAFRMEVVGSGNPNITVGNSAVLRTENVKRVVEKNNAVYYFKVRAVGKVGQSSAVYTTLPGQKAVRQCVITVSDNPEETLLNIAKSADSSEAMPMNNGTYYEDFNGDGTKDLLYFSQIITEMGNENQLDRFHVDVWYVDGKSQNAVTAESLAGIANHFSPYTYSVKTSVFTVQDKPEIFISTQSGGSAGPVGELFELGGNGEFRSISRGQYMEQHGQELWSIDRDYSAGYRQFAYSKLIWDAASRTYSKEFQYYQK